MAEPWRGGEEESVEKDRLDSRSDPGYKSWVADGGGMPRSSTWSSGPAGPANLATGVRSWSLKNR
jgi:hypothetical protein